MTLQQKIEIMQAAQRGEAIQGRSVSEDWITLQCPIWNWELFEYRIKPQPRTFYANEYSDGRLGVARPTEAASVRRAGRDAVRVVKLVEVLE